MCMDFLLTFLEGVITFVSPCLLPLLPVYLAYFAGGAQGLGAGEGLASAGDGASGGDAGSGSDAGSGGGTGSGLRGTVVCSLCFVAGFALVFTLMGAGAGAVGSLLVRHRLALNVACGMVLVVLGLNYLGVLNIRVLNRTLRAGSAGASRGPLGSLLFGIVFAVGWSPCVGTFLASALSMAASSADAATGVLLLLSYSAGLGLPFVLSAVLVNQLEGAFAWVKRHYDAVNKVSGALLVLMGALMACGVFGA